VVRARRRLLLLRVMTRAVRAMRLRCDGGQTGHIVSWVCGGRVVVLTSESSEVVADKTHVGSGRPGASSADQPLSRRRFRPPSQPPIIFSSPRIANRKGKGSPYSITERRVPELIPVLRSPPAGDVSHKPGGRLHYFPPGPQLPSQPLSGLLPISLLGEQRHDVCEQFA